MVTIVNWSWPAKGGQGQLQIEWNVDQIVLRDAGLDPDVQREESRLVDLEELKKLRGGTEEKLPPGHPTNRARWTRTERNCQHAQPTEITHVLSENIT